MNRVSIAAILLPLMVTGAAGQSLPPANITTDPATTPEVVQVLDRAGVWTPMGSINSTTHIFTPVSGSGLTPVPSDTVLGNASGASAIPSPLALPPCSLAANALIYTAGSGFGCNTISTGGGGGSSGFATHADLLAAITATPVPPFLTMHQQGFYSIGDGGAANYEWNTQSQCAQTASGKPNVPADTIVCILPPGQSPAVLGRWELQHGPAIDVRTIGMAPSVIPLIGFDNSPYVATLMNAMGSVNNALYSGGVDVEFPPITGQSWTTYWFTQPFVDSRGGRFHCSGDAEASGPHGVILGFAAGVSGFLAEANWYTTDNGNGVSALENCSVTSNGAGSGFASTRATVTGHFSGTNFILSSDLSGHICVGGTLAVAGGVPATVTQRPGGITTSCDQTLTGTFVVTPAQTLGPFTPTFTAGTGGQPGTVSGLLAANFPVGSWVLFYGGGTLPTGLSKNTQYAIAVASDTVAQLATLAAPTVPLSFTGSSSGAISADPEVIVTNSGKDIIAVLRNFADPLFNVPPRINNVGDALMITPQFGAYYPASSTVAAPFGTTIAWTSTLDPTVVPDHLLSNSIDPAFGAAAAMFTHTGGVGGSNVSVGDKFTIGNNTFTFTSPLGTTPGNVAPGLNFVGSMQNLGHAINGDGIAYPGAGAQYVTPPNTPNVTAIPVFTGQSYASFWAKAGGAWANTALKSTYQPVGSTVGTWSRPTFGGGVDGGPVKFIDLPVAQAYTIQSLTGNNTVLLTAGPRPPNPGDLVISDIAQFLGTTIISEHATSQFTQTGTNNFRNGDTILAANNTYTFVTALGSTPGTVLIGANWAASAANYVAAVNGTAGAGTAYIRATAAPAFNAVTGAFPADVNKINVVSVSNGRLGDPQPSVYTPTGAAAGSFQAATFTYQTITLRNATGVFNQNAGVTHTAASPGSLWNYPAGYVRRTVSKSLKNTFGSWGVGMLFNSSNAFESNASGGTRDEYNVFGSDQIGRFVAGDNTGGSTDIGDQFVSNGIMDIYEGGTLGSIYFGVNMETPESGTGPYSILMNCANQNNSSMFGGYNAGSHGGCATPVGIIPATPGGPLQVAVGPTPLFGNHVMGTAGFLGGWSFNDSNAGTGATISVGSSLGFTGVLGNTWSWVWNTATKAWELGSGLNIIERMVNTSQGYTGYTGPGTLSMQFPTGFLLGSWENQATIRGLSLSAVVPADPDHIQGDTQINATAVPGGNALWQDAPSFTTTLADFVWAGGGGFTGNISGTTLNVTSVHNATPVFTPGTGGAPGTIAGLSPAEFAAGNKIIFIGSGTLPTGLVLNNQYVILVASATVATIAQASSPTVPISFTGSGSGTITATKAICVGGTVSGTGVAGVPKIVSLPGGATHGCAAGVTGAYPISAGATGGASFPVTFTGGTPGTVSGLTLANFPLNSWISFYDGGSGVLPTGLAFNTMYLVQTASATAAQLALGPDDKTPLAFTGAGSGTILADEKLTSTGQTVANVAACPAAALPAGTPVDNSSDSPPTLIGTLSTCTGTTLTLQGAAGFQGAIGDTIKFMQWYPGARIANDTAGTSWTFGNYMTLTPVTLASLPATCTAGTFAVISNGVASPTYNAPVGSTTGAAANQVFCTNGNVWTYH